jgi:glycosyltransferase involved in cell wall biosynthesis
MLKQKKAISHQLVIVGKKGWFFKEVFEGAAASDYDKDIIFCDFVLQEDLVALYNAADVFAYPSLYEGFGLPLLEAMACNCPVVASNRSSIPEVCSDAALLVDPLDPTGIADAIFRILADSHLRKSLVEKGRRRVEMFSWKRTAEETLRIYNSLA